MKVIYEPSGKAREYAELACNLFNGCAHGCKYCYAPAIRRQSLAQWQENPQPRKNILADLEKDAEKLSGDPREVLFCFMSDPYQNDEAALLTTQALEIMANYDCRATILTKGGMMIYPDLDLIEQNDFKFGTSLSFIDDKSRQEWEPNAATIESRIDAIKAAKSRGIFTWVSVEPVIDPAQALEVIRRLYPLVDYWKIGKLNHNKEIESKIDWTLFLSSVKELLTDCGAEYYIKKDLAAFGKTEQTNR